MTDLRWESALAALREDPDIMRQIRDLAATSAMTMEDAARACAHVMVPLAESGERVVEYAQLMSGGGMHVRCDDPEIERIFPLADWIPAQRRFGGKVFRRTVIVVDDWQEVTEPCSST